MPQVKESLIKKLVRKALNEAELTAGDSQTKFNITVDLGNPQSETKLGIRVKLTPKEGMLEPDTRDQLSVAIMKKLNTSLGQFDIQVSKDTDASTQSPEVIGFFIPLSQIKNMIINSIKGPGEPKEPEGGNSTPPPPSLAKKQPIGPPDLPGDDEEEIMEENDPYAKWKTGLSLKRSGYEDEQGGEIPIEDLYKDVSTIKDLMLRVWIDIVNKSDYKFKEYLENNEDQWVRTGAVVSMVKDDLEDRLEKDEPVGEKGISEIIVRLVKEGKIKPFIPKNNLNEGLKVRELNEISRVVIKEDFYNFINAGNNVLRTLEENGFESERARKYLEHLVKFNIV